MRIPPSCLRVLIAFITLSAVAGGEDLPTLTSVAAIRVLRSEQAAQNYPVRLEGIVTYFDGAHGHAFLQDETGGIYFRAGHPDQEGRLEFKPGERISISGVTVMGKYLPSVAGAPPEEDLPRAPVQAERLGTGRLPEPPLITAEQLQSGAFNDQFVRLRATIRVVSVAPTVGGMRLGLLLSGPLGVVGWKLPAYIAMPSGPVSTRWENAVAELRGVAVGSEDEREGMSHPQLLVPSPKQVRPDYSVVRSAFALPPRPIGEIFRYGPEDAGAGSPYVRVRGVVTLPRPGEGVYIGDSESGLWVQTPQLSKTKPGDMLDVIGIPGNDNRGGHLQDAIFRVSGSAELPEPRLVEFDQALDGEYLAARISLEGQLVDELRQPGFRLLILENGGRRFQARIVESADPAVGSGWKAGSRLRVTGICEPPPPPTPGAALQPLLMLVGSDDGVMVVRPAPRLTPERVRWLMIALSGTIALSALWLLMLRRQVRAQTQVISEQTAQKTLTEERQRIARELHDTLEQQLAGIQLQLDAVTDWLPAESDDVRRALRAARGMLDHSRTEARRSVLELRSAALEKYGLAGAVRHSVDQVTDNGAPQISIETQGNERTLARSVEFHLLRIIQEAITNVLKHAEAEKIEVVFDFTGEELRVTVRDDGSGFDPATATADGKLHFGLMGMRERVAKVHGKLDIQTEPGEGTSIIVTAPDSPPSP